MTIDPYTLVQLFRKDPGAAVSELIKHDRSVHTKEVAVQIIKRMEKDLKLNEERAIEDQDAFAILEQALAEYEAYDQLSLLFIQTFSRLGLSMDSTDRFDPDVMAKATNTAYSIIDGLAYLVSKGINPSRFLRCLIRDMQMCCDPATGENQSIHKTYDPDNGSLSSSVLSEITNVGKIEEFNDRKRAAYAEADLMKDLSLIIFRDT